MVIRQGNKYGVKIRSEAPSIHLIRANIETEIAPIVGSEQQANDLIALHQGKKPADRGRHLNTNIFGKLVEQLVEDGIRGKLTGIGDECQEKAAGYDEGGQRFARCGVHHHLKRKCGKRMSGFVEAGRSFAFCQKKNCLK